MAIAAAWGAENWQNKADEAVAEEDGLLVAAALDEGDTLVQPIGASVIYTPKLCPFATIAIDAGIRYVFVDSDIDAAIAISDGVDTIVAEDTVDIEDGVIGRVGANVEIPVTERAALFVGGGYQFDLVKGDVKAFDEDLGENELAGAFVRAGVNFTF